MDAIRQVSKTVAQACVSENDARHSLAGATYRQPRFLRSQFQGSLRLPMPPADSLKDSGNIMTKLQRGTLWADLAMNWRLPTAREVHFSREQLAITKEVQG